MSINNPDHISGFLREQLKLSLQKASFDIGYTAIKGQGTILESIETTPRQELAARVEILQKDISMPSPIDRASWLLGITGAIVDERTDLSHRELVEHVLSHSPGSSE